MATLKISLQPNLRYEAHHGSGPSLPSCPIFWGGEISVHIIIKIFVQYFLFCYIWRRIFLTKCFSAAKNPAYNSCPELNFVPATPNSIILLYVTLFMASSLLSMILPLLTPYCLTYSKKPLLFLLAGWAPLLGAFRIICSYMCICVSFRLWALGGQGLCLIYLHIPSTEQVLIKWINE